MILMGSFFYSIQEQKAVYMRAFIQIRWFFDPLELFKITVSIGVLIGLGYFQYRRETVSTNDITRRVSFVRNEHEQAKSN